MNEFIELLKQSVQIANEENGTSWGYIMLFDDGTVTYRTGGTISKRTRKTLARKYDFYDDDEM